MRRTPIRIVTTECRRCGKPLVTLNRSLYGADKAKARLDRLCESCTTPEERAEMLGEQAAAILNRE